MTQPSERKVLRYSVSLVTQGEHRFYTLTMPSEVLAETCYVVDRFDDPIEGFQRTLDKRRASEIAEYVDSGLGTIPSSIILSAQPEAQLKIVGQGKTLEFTSHKKAFMVLDGQHRVFGFSLAKTNMRVPVVIYNGLSRSDEAKIFIDVNSKQKPVPSELLADIKKLAEYENQSEEYMRGIFDKFHGNSDSALYGLVSPAKASKDKISRVTFNLAIKPIIKIFASRSDVEVYSILNSYIHSCRFALKKMDYSDGITSPTVFRAFLSIFPDVAQRVKSSGGEYTFDNFWNVIMPISDKIKISQMKKANNSFKALAEELIKAIKTDFVL
ncbi:DGQHR domain-containing protein [Deinococcus sp. 12RED42]|uniref:DGQHR domain-containing protein n=1 Tax=Deinococcus sp. 12RED42 TaxID=2745872 RepID=UPI0021054998|nr:DGQHR domain-containing protein [Deinococcus sp. 12RED42]MCD0166955.1 DGQHR domain-containing protein [Deinococcus sp. 12RED42]